MPVLSKGTTFADNTEVTATALNNLVDSSAFVSGAVDGATTQLSSGAIIVKDGGVTPAKLSAGAPTWTGGGAVSATSVQNTPIGSTTPSTGAFTTLAATDTTKLMEVLELATITAAAPASTQNYDLLSGAVVYLTSNTANNWILNIRGSSGTALNSVMATGESATMVLLVTNGTTAYYPTTHRIDGNTVTPIWLGGTAPSAGNASSVDVYTYTVFKTGSATFVVLASQSRFA
jgi:hypothetical protein